MKKITTSLTEKAEKLLEKECHLSDRMGIRKRMNLLRETRYLIILKKTELTQKKT